MPKKCFFQAIGEFWRGARDDEARRNGRAGRKDGDGEKRERRKVSFTIFRKRGEGLEVTKVATGRGKMGDGRE